MLPFPGESVGIFDASLDGSYSATLDLALRYRGGYTATAPTSATLTPGNVWRLWCLSSALDYLDPGDVAGKVVSWVVEVLSGSGTITAGETLDPDYASDYALPAASTLGAHAVTGPATLVIPSGFTAAQVLNAAGDDISFMLRLEASSGSLVVQQVKLRVWPAAGPVGGWSDVKPGWSTPLVAPSARAAVVSMSGTAFAGDAESAWDDAIDAYHADVAAQSAATARTLSSFSVGSTLTASASQQEILFDTAPTYRAQTASSGQVVVLTGADPAGRSPVDESELVEGVDWVRPPSEVAGDVEQYGDTSGSAPVTGWVDAYVTTDEDGDVPGGPSVVSQGGEFTPTGSNVWTLPLEHGAAVAGTVPLNVSAGDRRVVVSLSHSVSAGASDAFPGWTPNPFGPVTSETAGFTFTSASGDPIRTFVLMPAYRVWDPNGTEDILPRVRQLHRDDRGMTPRRHFGGASRATTGRHFGYD